MDIVQLILLLGSIAAAVTAIVVFVTKLVKSLKSVFQFFKDLSNNVATLLQHDDAQYKAILRLTITADHMPVSERLIAGKEYVEEYKGNGDVKAIYKELKEKCERATD